MPARRQSLESAAQIIIAQWLDLRGVVYFHCPLEGARSKAYAVHLSRMGTKAGIPDLMIPDRAPAWQGPHGAALARAAGCAVGELADLGGPVGLAIELKVSRYKARPSPAQALWLGKLADLGWATICCNGVVATLELLRAAGFDRRTPTTHLGFAHRSLPG